MRGWLGVWLLAGVNSLHVVYPLSGFLAAVVVQGTILKNLHCRKTDYGFYKSKDDVLNCQAETAI